MIKQRSGRIINISSIAGLTGNAGQANYAASKAGLIGLTKTLARELASRGITVNAVAPGFIVTDMTDVLSDQIKEAILAKIPLGKFGEGEDIAAAVAFLASAGSEIHHRPGPDGRRRDGDVASRGSLAPANGPVRAPNLLRMKAGLENAFLHRSPSPRVVRLPSA